MNADVPDSLAAVLAGVLADHRLIYDVVGWSCGRTCDWRERKTDGEARHRAHVADHLAQAVAADKAEAVRAGRPEALREAARLPASTLGDAWDVIHPSIMPPPPWSYLRRFLHAVADAVEAEQAGDQ